MQAYSTFMVGNYHFGVRTSDVIEFTKGLEVTPVPLGPPMVSGFLNLRGQIVTAIDIRKQLGLPPIEITASTISIFFKHEGALFSLLVDGVNDILELSDDDFEPPPSNLSASAHEILIGVYKLPKSLLIILDPQKIVGLIYSN